MNRSFWLAAVARVMLASAFMPPFTSCSGQATDSPASDPCNLVIAKVDSLAARADSAAREGTYYWTRDDAKAVAWFDESHRLKARMSQWIVDEPDCFSNSEAYEAKKYLGYSD